MRLDQFEEQLIADGQQLFPKKSTSRILALSGVVRELGRLQQAGIPC